MTSERAMSSERGLTLIEVMISALLVAVIVVGTFTGFDVTSRTTAAERTRAQADTLAQQAEDRLRGTSIATLSELEAKPRTETVKLNGTTYTIESTAQYVSDATATASCSSSASSSYLRTTSTVTWPSLGARKPVAETSIISPPPGTTLIAQVSDASAEGVAGMIVTATGPSPETEEHTLETAANGCAILALLPGSFNINVSKTGYVDENWYQNSNEDPTARKSVYLVAEVATKVPFRFAPAGTLEVEFTGSVPATGDSFVASNTEMAPSFKPVGIVGTYKSTVISPARVFPFKTEYSVYAGTCEADSPENNGPESDPEVLVAPGATAKVTVTQPPIKIQVMSGVSATKSGANVSKAEATITDTGCTPPTQRSFKTNASGAMPHPGLPFGKYSLCVTAELLPEKKHRKFTTAVTNSIAGGVEVPTIYLGVAKELTGCP